MAGRVLPAFAGCGAMSRQGRYWIFFVIVAVGLSLSWGQVGRKTRQVLEDEPVMLLVTETPCTPIASPCAAVGRDRALLLGPDEQGLRIRQTGIPVLEIIRVESVFVGTDGQASEPGKLLPDGEAWIVSGLPPGSVRLHIRVVGNRDVTVAEFPL